MMPRWLRHALMDLAVLALIIWWGKRRSGATRSAYRGFEWF